MLSRGGETEEGRKEERCLPFAASGPFVIPPGDPITLWSCSPPVGVGSRATLQNGAFTFCINSWEQRYFVQHFITRALIHVSFEKISNES